MLLADGAVLPYDSLIVVTGSQTSYFGHDEWQQWAPGPKSVEEATMIRHKILYAFEVAERILDPVQRHAWLTFVIVGAGPTGVELAGAIAMIARQTLKNDFRSIRPEESQIILLDGAPRVLMSFPEDLAQKATRSLAALGVRLNPGVLRPIMVWNHRPLVGHIRNCILSVDNPPIRHSPEVRLKAGLRSAQLNRVGGHCQF